MPGRTRNGETTVRTKVLTKRENLVMGKMTFYYIGFEDSLELRVPHKIYKKVNFGDVVKLTYSNGSFVNLSIIEKSNEMGIPKITNSGDFTDKDRK